MFPNNFTSNQVSTVSWESVNCFSNCTCNLTVEDQTQMSSLCSGPYFSIPVWQKMLTDHQLCTQYQQSGCKECLGSPAPLPTPSTAVAITESGGWGWSPSALGGCYREGFFYHSSSKSHWIASRCQNVTASIYSGWHSSFVSCFINIWHVLEHFIAWNVFKKSEREESFLLVPRMSDHPRAAAAATAVPFSPWGTQFINVLLSPIYLFVLSCCDPFSVISSSRSFSTEQRRVKSKSTVSFRALHFFSWVPLFLQDEHRGCEVLISSLCVFCILCSAGFWRKQVLSSELLSP